MKRSAPLLLALGAILLAAACGQDTQTESVDASRRPNSSSSGGTGSSSSGSSSSNGGASSNGGTTSSGGPSGSSSSGATSSSSGSHASSSSSSGSSFSSSSSGARPSSSSSSGASSGSSSSSGSASSSSGTTSSSSSGSGSSSGAPGGTCGSAALNTTPFGCTFAWGTNDSGGSLSSFSYLQFMSKWVGYEVKADGSISSCDGASWLAQVASTNLIPVYYAYFIGYLGHANGFADGNQNPNGPNLTTDGANLIRNNRAKIVEMYRYYAQQSAKAWKTKPLVWLLEGDMVQYSASTQKNALSYAELAQLTADITCAIKSSMPNAVVAINHSTWNPNDVTNSFWGAMKSANVSYDLAWTSGAANANGFFDSGTNTSSYNGGTATYAYLHKVSGRPILVDTSFGLSAQGDTWSNGSAATLNARIADGVIAANVTSVPSNYASAISALAPSLKSTCQ